jgi:lipopolysaccharide export system protein LptA
MGRLLRILGIRKNLLLTDEADLLSEGYRIQGEKIAYEISEAALKSRKFLSVAQGQ